MIVDIVDLGVCRSCGEFEGMCKCGRGEVLIRVDERMRVSKFLSGLLRHFGREFGLQIDRDGWIELRDVVKVLKERYGVGKRQVELIVKFDAKRRFELKNGKIRARYGHSIDINTRWSERGGIPEKLYHATSPENLNSILRVGLLPMKRKEVHLSASPEEALEVGLRHSKNPVLLEVDVKKLLESGIEIRKKGRVYTADCIPPSFLKVIGEGRS